MKHLTLGPSALACKNCGGPISFNGTFCSYCRAPQAVSALPELQRGEPYFSLDFTRDQLPGGESTNAVRRADGILLDVPARGMLLGDVGQPMRDSCVSMSGICLSPHVTMGVMARMNRIESARVGYTLQIRPGFRTYCLRRVLTTPQETILEPLRDWEVTREVAPVGQPNHIELRFAESVLTVAINGSVVTTLIDARFGFGLAGWRLTTFDERGQVLLRSFEIRAVY